MGIYWGARVRAAPKVYAYGYHGNLLIGSAHTSSDTRT